MRNKNKFPKKINQRKYGERFKNQFKKNTIFYGKYYPFIDELKLKIIKRTELSKNIIMLPEELQKRLYIICMREYWKHQTLTRSLKPMWWDYKSHMDKEIGKCYFKNIHFLHLECNTLPEMKEWIPGCQCNFCQNDKKEKEEDKILTYRRIYEDFDINQFNKRIHCYEIIPNYWNIHLDYWMTHEDFNENKMWSIRVFDPLYNFLSNNSYN